LDRFAGLLDYYEKLQSLSEAPVASYSAIKMDQLAELLPWCFLCEWRPPEALSIILTGTAIDTLLAISPDQVTMFDADDRPVRDIYCKYFSNITEVGCGGYTQRLIPNSAADVYLVSAAYLPLKSRKAVANYVLGAVDVVLESAAEKAAAANFIPGLSSILELSYFDIGGGIPAGGPRYGAESIPTLSGETDWAEVLKFK
jgi:hypothetical protein